MCNEDQIKIKINQTMSATNHKMPILFTNRWRFDLKAEK
jgi:hypothetical protein